MERSVNPFSTVFISVGSNIGDKPDNCKQGVALIEKNGDAIITGRSFFYRTSPVDYLDQDWFVNAAVRIETKLNPPDLLDALFAIQKKMGRKKGGVRFGPRVLDLDIIFYDDLAISSDRLVLPHPRMHKRAFVLKPICDIDPLVMHPVLKMDVKTIAQNLSDDNQEIFRIPELNW